MFRREFWPRLTDGPSSRGSAGPPFYRRADLRAVVDEHRARRRDATTLTGLTVIDPLRRSLEAIAARVRRHEEQLRRLERAHRKDTR